MFGSFSYRRAAGEAAQILLDNEVTAYPLNPVCLANRAGIKILTYPQFASLADLPEETLLSLSGDGFSTCVDGQYLIVYNRTVRPRNRRRWTLLHEYCHIYLGHVPEDGALLPDYPNDRPMEAAADELTGCLIAPLPLAFLCRIDTEEEMARCFGLSEQAAANLFHTYRRYCCTDLSPVLGYGKALEALCPFAIEYAWRKEKEARRQHYRLVDIEAEAGEVLAARRS
ncbi:MAG TPA: ImmA/IrrE family metallo-endopeptidase [Firmicutes bacterium]|nr:ImmA/IrrE family metallo-endopeptidase [Bacillota bacterium]